MPHSGFRILVLALLMTGAGCKTEALQGGNTPGPGESKATDSIAPQDVTEIRLIKRSGGPPLPGIIDVKENEILLVRDQKSARYFNRLSKAMIDNGFLNLENAYRGTGLDGPVVTITLKWRNNEKTVANGDRALETNPTFVFELLIRAADAEINAHLQKKE